MKNLFLSVALALLSLAAAPAIALAGQYSWAPVGPAWPTQWALFHDGWHVGTYDADDGVYRPKNPQTGEWGDACDIPEEAGMPEGVARNFGLRPSHFSRKERYSISGVEVDRSAVMDKLTSTPEPLGGKQVPNDGQLPRVTVAGSVQGCAPVLQALSRWKDRYVVNDYRPTAWQLIRQGFVSPADPTIYVQDADGTVLRRLDGYTGDQAALDQVLDECLGLASRKRQPYDPSKDPGWACRILPWLKGSRGTLVLVGVAGLLIVLPFVLRKHK